jgi:hypothetical protein
MGEVRPRDWRQRQNDLREERVEEVFGKLMALVRQIEVERNLPPPNGIATEPPRTFDTSEKLNFYQNPHRKHRDAGPCQRQPPSLQDITRGCNGTFK